MPERVTFPVSSVLRLLLPLEFTACDLPVAQQTPSQLEVHLDLQEFRSFIHVTWEMYPVYTQLYFPPISTFYPFISP